MSSKKTTSKRKIVYSRINVNHNTSHRAESEDEEMNWLMYAGGGFLFIITFLIVIRSVMICPDEKFKKWELRTKLIYIGFHISPSLVWFWICWRVIR